MARQQWPSYEGTIAFCSREDQIYPLFSSSLARLMQRHGDVKLVQMMSNDIADARNQAVLQAEGDWIWFIDTDMVFAPDTLERLLKHGVDMVQVLCLKRHPPHEPIMWEDDPHHQNFAPRWSPRLIEVQSLGAGGTLYRRKVFHTVSGPWFEGILGVEDTNFAAKAKAKGFKLYVDLATPVGHTTPMVIWPQYDPEQMRWKIRYDAMNGPSMVLPTIDESLIVRPKALV